jgi:tripartite-type tricarboxylate transporter receptor subunit TctC
MNRIACVILNTAFALLAGAASTGYAQQKSSLPGNYPHKPIRILVGGLPGGGTDIIARVIGQRLSEKWGHSVVTENRASGLGSIIAMETTAKAPPDGYTLHLASSSAYMNAALITKVPYDVRSAFAPILQLTTQPYVLTMYAALPVSSVKELIAYGKSKSGGLNYGTSGTGTASHLGMELFRSMAGLNMVQINYKGSGGALTDLMAGQIQLIFASAISAIPLAKAGRVKALAVGSLERSKLLPDIPTIAESGLPGFELTGWYGLISTAGTPPAIVIALNQEAGNIMQTTEMKEKLAAGGGGGGGGGGGPARPTTRRHTRTTIPRQRCINKKYK